MYNSVFDTCQYNIYTKLKSMDDIRNRYVSCMIIPYNRIIPYISSNYNGTTQNPQQKFCFFYTFFCVIPHNMQKNLIIRRQNI